jgi:hypothetical protein
MTNAATDFISSHFREAVKTFSVYDGTNRLIEFYTALTDAEDSGMCLKTEYSYDGATTRILKSKESLATWSSAWDI